MGNWQACTASLGRPMVTTMDDLRKNNKLDAVHVHKLSWRMITVTPRAHTVSLLLTPLGARLWGWPRAGCTAGRKSRALKERKNRL